MYDIFEKLLIDKGLRTVDVCKATGISQSTISNWKKRGNMLNPATLKKIAEYLGVSLDYLMGNDLIQWNPGNQEIIDLKTYISEEERNIIELYRMSDESTKDMIKTILKYNKIIKELKL